MDFFETENKIKESFFHQNGPGELPLTTRKNNVFGIIVPSANMPVAAWGYKEVAESRFFDTYIVIIPGGFNSVCLNDFKTVFGTVKTDKELGEEVVKKFRFAKAELPGADMVFLQFVSKRYLHSLKVLVIALNEFVDEFAEFLAEQNNVFFICITNLSRSFGGVYNSRDTVLGNDQRIIKFVKILDSFGLMEFVKKKEFNFGCALGTMIEVMKLKFMKPNFLMYDVSGLDNYSVGCASFVFKG